MMLLMHFAMWTQLAFATNRRQRPRCMQPFPRTAGRTGLFAFVVFFLIASEPAFARDAAKKEDLWSLQPIVRAEVPQGVTSSPNPIDAFIAEACREKKLSPLGPADKLTWLRRVSLDLIGLPPTIEEQESFLADQSAGA